MKKHRETCDHNDELTKQIAAVNAVAVVSLPDDAVLVLSSLSEQLRKQSDQHLSAVERIRTEAPLFQEAFNHIATFAKRDLGGGN